MFSLHKSKFYTFYITILLILTSGTVFVGRIYYYESLALLLFSSILMFNGKINKKSLIYSTIYTSVILANLILTNNTDTSTYLTYSIKFISVFLIFNSINLKLFLKYLILIFASISFLSLIFYSFGLLFPNYIRMNIPIVEAWGNPLRVTPLYIFQEWHMHRNNGLYWESGAFQTFINLAVLLTIKSDFTNKSKKKLHLLFFVTLLTTFSTTGYLVYALIIFSQYRHWLKLSWLPKLVFMLMLIVPIIYIEEATIGTIKKKFDQTSYEFNSTERRSYDFQVGVDLLAQKPFLGWGFGNRDMYNNYAYQASSNGLMTLAAQFGIFFISFILLYYFFIIRYFSNSIYEGLILMTATIFILSSQDLLLYPLFIVPMFIVFRLKDLNFESLDFKNDNNITENKY